MNPTETLKIQITGAGTLEEIQKELAALTEALAKKTTWHFEGHTGMDLFAGQLHAKIDRV